MRPSPTTAELYLAYRCTKLTKCAERGAAVKRRFASWEISLGDNIRSLRALLARPASWFDDIEVGDIWVVPKNQPTAQEQDNATMRVGGCQSNPRTMRINVNLHLAGTVEYHVAETLYLWRFGPVLEKTVPGEAVGNRLRLDRDGTPYREARNLYEWWPARYREFQSSPLREARRILRRNNSTGSCWLISLDLASFYSNVDPMFMVEDRFVAKLMRTSELYQLEFDRRHYLEATESLLRSYERFNAKAKSVTGVAVTKGIPIGALTSPVVANAALAPLDRAITINPEVSCYRRYVDDMLIIANSVRGTSDHQDDILRELTPCKSVDGNRLVFDETVLNRAGSRFSVKSEKTRVFRLEGREGIDFLGSVSADLNRITSERRLLVHPDLIKNPKRLRLIGTTGGRSSPLRVLRDADRTRLEKLSLSVAVASLLRSSLLLEQGDARNVFREAVSPILRALQDHRNWVDNLQHIFQMLELAILVGANDSAKAIIGYTDEIWSQYESIGPGDPTVHWGDSLLTTTRSRVWLRNYLHEQRMETICRAIPLPKRRRAAPPWLQAGILLRRKVVKERAIRTSAVQLSQTDLRTRDWEDSADAVEKLAVDQQLINALRRDHDLARRFDIIRHFITACVRLGDETWVAPPETLFLATRPPRYFDVARRLLYQADRKMSSRHAFEVVRNVVNALRGTRYIAPTGRVIDESTVEIGDAMGGYFGTLGVDPRLILGNLVLDPRWYKASIAKRGSPVRSKARLMQLSDLLDKADRVARQGRQRGTEQRPALLVLPELAIPRAWMRTVANVVIRNAAFGLVSGIEYWRHGTKPIVYNQVLGVFPGGWSSTTAWTWTKIRPADEEARALASQGLSFEPPPVNKPRTVLQSPYGNISVLVCSELIEPRLIAELFGRADVVLVPSWNTDTSSYDHLLASVGLQLHAVVGISNNGHYSDCRAWAPRYVRWQRELCRIIGRDIDDVIFKDIPLRSLRQFHRSGASAAKGEWKPLPPGYSEA